MTNDQELIDKIQLRDSAALKHVYLVHKQQFLAYFSRFDVRSIDLIDIYQDSIVALCENIYKGKLDRLNSSISTYIIAIGKYKVYAILKKENREVPLDLESIDFDKYEDESIEQEIDSRISRIQQAFAHLGKKCQEVLRLFYYENKKLDEIQVIMQYESKDVLKSQKSRCLKTLKDLTSDK